MKYAMPRSHLWAFSLALGLSATACGDDDESGLDASVPADAGRTFRTDAGFDDALTVARASGAAAFATALDGAGISARLASGDDFTLLAPTDAALSAVTLPTDADLLENLLLHHVAPFRADSTALFAGPLRVSTQLDLATDAANQTVGGVKVSQSDLRASDGIVHVIDGVLTLPTIPQILGPGTQTSSLAAAVALASSGVQAALAAPGPITVFAPLDSAFASIDATGILTDATYLDSVLQTHVVSGQTLSSGLTPGMVLTTASGQALTVSQEAGGTFVLSDGQSRVARIVTPDVRLANGVVHLIDQVLLPARNATDLISTLRRNNRSSFANLVTQAGLTTPFSSGGPFTVLAPTDGALNLASPPTNADLAANLVYAHVLSGRQTVSSIAAQSSVTTVSKTNLGVDIAGGSESIGSAQIGVARDVTATNGVLHTIDSVLALPSISEQIASDTRATSFGTAIAAAPTADQSAFSAAGPMTVFIPVTSGFPASELTAIAADSVLARDFVGYHRADGQMLSGQLTDGQTLTMSTGATLTVRISGSTISLIDGAGTSVSIVEADVRRSNGVIHFISAPLRAGHLYDIAQANGLTRFATLMTAAGLNASLFTGGPYTTFAPTNTAVATFETTGQLSMDRLAANVLANIFTSHLVPLTYSSAELAMRSVVSTEGKVDLTVTSTMGTLTVGGATLGTVRDQAASNGVLHTLDTVLLPPTVPQFLSSTTQLSLFSAAVSRASSTVQAYLDPQVLALGRAITVFAPTNAAMTAAGLDPSTMSQSAIDALVQQHVVRSQLLSADFSSTGSAVATYFQPITVTRGTSGTYVRDPTGSVSTVTDVDIRALNGAVHLIDTVLGSN